MRVLVEVLRNTNSSNDTNLCFIRLIQVIRGCFLKAGFGIVLLRGHMEEAGEAAAEAAIHIVDIGIEDTDGGGERDKVVVSDGGWNETAVALTDDDFIACGAYMEFAVAIDAHGDDETIVFQQVAMEWLADFKDADAEIW